MNSTSISRRESEIITKIKEYELVIFTPKDVQRFLGISDRNTYQILQRMKQKNIIINVEQGKYMLEEQWNSLDIYDIASSIITPSYIGFWSALHIHHLTDQVPQKIFVVTTKRKRSQRLQHQKITFVTIKPYWFFGYERYQNLIVSDKEKTIIDCLHIPAYSGGIPQIYNALSAELNIERLISYCQRTESSTIASRLGFLLEKKQLLNDNSSLKEMITSYALLDPEGDNKKLNSKWKLYTGGEIE
jgi:predicted transcriptional regulator of viral defense system